MHQKNHKKSAGFTLVELAIVLVIIGLIIGGVLVGQNLIQAAEIRKTISEYQQWQAAANTFRTKFNAMPGDIRTATRYWGETTGCASATTLNLNDKTCDGNGDKTFYDADSVPPKETFLFWHHLSLAQLVPGSFGGDVTTSTDPGDFRAKSVLGGYWYVDSTPPSLYSGLLWPASIGKNVYYLRNTDGSASITPEQAFNIDSKVDDGRPSTGKVTAPPSTALSTPECTVKADDVTPTEVTDKDAKYKIANTDIACTLYLAY